MTLPGFSVRQGVLVNLLFVVMMLGGAVSLSRIPVDFYPDISFNTTLINTIWTGASPDDVERLITTKIEDELLDVSGIKEIRSFSRPDYSTIGVEWDETLSDAEYESGLANLRAAVERVSDLPPDAEEPLVRELSVGETFSVVMVAVVDGAGVGETTLLEVARDVKSRLDDLPGVRKVTIRGEQDREVRVVVDRDAAARYGLSLLDVAERIRRKNVNLPAGSFTTSEGEATLRATGDYRSLEEILSTVLRETPSGSYVRLRDVARIEEGIQKRRFYGRYNGHPAFMLGIAKENDAHITRISEEVRAWVERYRPMLPAGMEIHSTWDTSEWVMSRMDTLRNNLYTGILLVVAILWFTIGFRNAALTVVAIPFSFLTAFILFPLMDLTINSFSLIGMLLVSGMLVDDAIIVLENIYRRIEEGEPLGDAVLNGAEEVMWPVISAVSTTCAAFFPLLLIEGTSGEFMSILPKTVIVCLAASLFECLLILPAHYLDFGSRHTAGERAARWGRLGGILSVFDALHGRVDAGISWLRGRYLRALDVVLTYRASFGTLSVAIFLMSMAGATHLRVDLFSSEYNYFFVLFEGTPEFGIDQTDEVYRGVEQKLEALREEGRLLDYSSYIGNSLAGGMDNIAAPNYAISYVMAADRPEYVTAPEKVVALVQERLDEFRAATPRGIVDLRAMPPRQGPPIGKPVAVRIQSDDYLLAKAIALEMQEYLRTVPGVSSIEDNLREGPREIRLVVDEARAGQHGLGFESLARAFRGANDGLVASTYRPPDEEDEVDIRVLPESRFRGDVGQILETEVQTPGGYFVKIGDVADVEVGRSFLSLSHFDGNRAVTVYADVDEDQATSTTVNRDLAAHFADLPIRFPEVEVVYGGEFQATADAFAEMRAAFPIALLLVYMILAAQFRSYVQPLVVCSAIPFGLIGVVLGVGLMGYSVSFGMLYAVIGLTGVVVNDSLVMVDFINRSRAGGMPLLEAVRQSGAQRLRPILLTTLTTVVALIPMALGLAGASKSYGPFAASITFGLIVAMVGTLFAVPLFYTALIVNQERARGLLARWRARPAGESAALDPARGRIG